MFHLSGEEIIHLGFILRASETQKWDNAPLPVFRRGTFLKPNF